jgi:hypothetical protein
MTTDEAGNGLTIAGDESGGRLSFLTRYPLSSPVLVHRKRRDMGEEPASARDRLNEGPLHGATCYQL